MGMGEIFRAVAAALQSGAQFPLDEAEKRRQIREKVELAKFKSTNDPLEQLLMQARIDSINRRNAGGGGGPAGKGTAIDGRVEAIIQAEEVQRGQPYDPRDRAKRQVQLLGASLFKPSSKDYGDEEINPSSPIPVSMPGFLPRRGTPAPVAPTPVPAATPSPTNNASVIQEANEAIRRGADPVAVKERLRKLGVSM